MQPGNEHDDHVISPGAQVLWWVLGTAGLVGAFKIMYWFSPDGPFWAWVAAR